MRLETGKPAPEFKGPAHTGEEITLDGLGGRLKHIQFHRFVGCPVCNLRVREFVNRYEDVRAAGVETVMVFHTPLPEIQAHVEGSPPPFPIVADPDRLLYDAYGVERSMLGIMSPSFNLSAVKGMLAGFAATPWGQGGVDQIPADFVVDEDGVLKLARYGRHGGDSLSVDALLSEVARM